MRRDGNRRLRPRLISLNAHYLRTWSKPERCLRFRARSGLSPRYLMPCAVDSQGRVILLISNMAAQTQNLKADPHASLFVTPPAEVSDPLGVARVTLIMIGSPIPKSDVARTRATYLLTHPSSEYWVDCGDFGFFWLQPIDLYHIGGFGVMSWIDATHFAAASPDPLATAAPGIIAHTNQDHVDTMILLARLNTDSAEIDASITPVDRLEFRARLKTAAGTKTVRVNFPEEV